MSKASKGEKKGNSSHLATTSRAHLSLSSSPGSILSTRHTCARVKRLSRNLIEREEKTRKSLPLLPLVLIKQSWIKRQVKTPGANYRPITRAIRGSRLASSETKTRGEAPLLERDRARASESENERERERARERKSESEIERERERERERSMRNRLIYANCESASLSLSLSFSLPQSAPCCSSSNGRPVTRQ